MLEERPLGVDSGVPRVMVAAGGVGLAGVVDGNATSAGVLTGVVDAPSAGGTAVMVAGAGADLVLEVHAPTAEIIKNAEKKMIKCLGKPMESRFATLDWRHPAMIFCQTDRLPRGCWPPLYRISGERQG